MAPEHPVCLQTLLPMKQKNVSFLLLHLLLQYVFIRMADTLFADYATFRFSVKQIQKTNLVGIIPLISFTYFPGYIKYSKCNIF